MASSSVPVKMEMHIEGHVLLHLEKVTMTSKRCLTPLKMRLQLIGEGTSQGEDGKSNLN